jgi:UDP-MurNAc hydroxylase
MIGTLVGVLPSVVFDVVDLNAKLRFDWRRGLQPTPQITPFDIALHSDALAYLFRHDWGLDTLHVSGRFRAEKGGLSKLIRTFSAGSLNNIGRRLGLALLFDMFLLKRAVRKLINPFS